MPAPENLLFQCQNDTQPSRILLSYVLRIRIASFLLKADLKEACWILIVQQFLEAEGYELRCDTCPVSFYE